ncbi:MAG: tyrosine-type recombinase/integrase [Nitrososphaeraceae archaeon]|nr:tyrosine-type recombinase/integrase [Nitrososphaeraceae archaeon]
MFNIGVKINESSGQNQLINHDILTTDDPITEYIESVRNMSSSTAHEYHLRLDNFRQFVTNEFDISIDQLMQGLEQGVFDVYHVLSKYVKYLCSKDNGRNLSPTTIKLRISTARGFLESQSDKIEISPRKFILRVKMPKIIKRKKAALSKTDVINIINSCSNIRLKTYILLLASTGMRATEAFSTRVCDYELDSAHPTVVIRGEYTKTKTDRTVLLNKELVQQIKLWKEYKYRRRRISFYSSTTNIKQGKRKALSKYVVPERNDEHLLFAIREEEDIKPGSLYKELCAEFARTLDRIGKGSRENNNFKGRRKITLHSFRRYVKTTISDLGFSDFSEYYIGHSGSMYYTKPEKDTIQIFEKIEPYLTFLDYEELERKGADIASQLEEKDKMIQNMMRKQEQFEQLIQSLIDSGQLKPTNHR